MNEYEKKYDRLMLNLLSQAIISELIEITRIKISVWICVL